MIFQSDSTLFSLNIIKITKKSNYDQLFCSKMWGGGKKNEDNKKIIKSVKNDRKMKKYFPSKFQHELWTPCPHRIVQLRTHITQY